MVMSKTRQATVTEPNNKWEGYIRPTSKMPLIERRIQMLDICRKCSFVRVLVWIGVVDVIIFAVVEILLGVVVIV